MRVTIRTVARQAGVSVATVSRVLNTPEQVGLDTKAKVQAVIRDLNFEPSAIARGLSAHHPDTLGLLVPGITDFFFNEIYQGIDLTAQHRGFRILLYTGQYDQERILKGFSFLHQHQVSGIIFMSKLVAQDYFPIIERVGVPVVLALTESTGERQLPAFKVDDLRATFDAVSYLVSRGHRCIGMISGPLDDLVAGKPRLDGYRRGLEHYGLPFSEDLVAYGEYRYDHGYTAMGKILAARPTTKVTAVLAADDEMAIGAMRRAFDEGLQVPQDISVMGYDNLPMANMAMPKLTTVAQPFADIGHAVVEHLVGLIEKPRQASTLGTVYLPHRIVERESVTTVNR
ncbi:LacI family transcriptional regulator [Alicyclobacillaceae bacterium I2511]|nr:LacI family transcriptional regulator [Alicyclobacillaceae bacterium I2511]